MNSISSIVLSFAAISTALPQFNQDIFPNRQQQGFPNIIGNQNPFLPGNQGFGIVGNLQDGQQVNFGNQKEGSGVQQPSFGDQQGFGSQLQQQQQQQQQQPGASSSIVGTPQFVLCNQNCPSVNQYNPICGSDQVTYNNQYRLDCANDCGRQLDPNWQEITILSRRNCVSGSRVA